MERKKTTDRRQSSPSEMARVQYEDQPPLAYYARRALYKYVVPPLQTAVEIYQDPDIQDLNKSMTGLERRLADRLYSRGYLSGNEKLLEIGCGPGDLLDYLRLIKQHRGEMVGIDIHPNFFDFNILKRKQLVGAPTWETGVVLKQGDGEALEWDDNSFDTVFIDNMLYHTDNPTTVISEAKRVLKPDGVLVVSTRGQNNMAQLWKLEQSKAQVLSKRPEYAGLVAPGSFYNDFGIRQVRREIRNNFTVLDDFEESARTGYHLAIPESGWSDLRTVLIYIAKDNFEGLDEETGDYAPLPPRVSDMTKLVDNYIKPRHFDPEISQKGFFRMDVEELYIVARNDKKPD
jgi:SAM-dependent methyltransferase